MTDARTRLPDAVIDHVYSDDLDRWYREFFAREGLADDARGTIEEAVSDVYHKRVSLDAFVEAVRRIAGDHARGTAIAVDILGNDFLRIEDWIGIDVAAYIRHLGGDPALYVKRADPDAVVEEIVRDVDGLPTDAMLMRRVRDALRSLLVDARTAAQAQDSLVRSSKVGGAGMQDQNARRLIGVLEARKQELRSAGVQLKPATSLPPTSSAFHILKPTASGVIQPEDEEEIARMQRESPEPVARASAVDTAVERIIRITGARFGKEETAKRFRAALASRFRDVRDAEETRAVLLRPYAEGGMGLPAETVRKLSIVIEREVGKMLGGKPSAIRNEKFEISNLKSQITRIPAPTTPVVPKVLVVSEQPHVAPVAPPSPPQTGGLKPAATSAPKPVSLPVVAPPAARRAESQIANLKSHITPTSPPLPLPPKPVLAPVAPQPKPPALRPVAPPAPTDGELKLAATPVVPPPPRPVPAVSRADTSQLATRNSQLIRDIRPPRPKLVGPIEELEQLTIDDFRKIAKSPADAAANIAEKLTLLDRRSHTDRAQGLKALRGSPLFTMYADILNTALTQGKPVDAILASAGTISKDEFDALMGLTMQLRV